MRCIAVCAAQKYQLKDARDHFRRKNYSTRVYRNTVLHIYKKNRERDIFIFSHGVIVLWGYDKSAKENIIQDLLLFSIFPIESYEENTFIVRFAEKTEMLVHKRSNLDIIILENHDPSIKLAISYGLSQSIKLEFYETMIQQAADKNASIAETLAKKGGIRMGRKAIAKRIGELFQARSYINLNSEYLGVPEYFWEHAGSENYYIMCEKFLDIPNRVNALNKKLDVLQDLFDILNNQLQHLHSVFLEATIIVLIFIEIVLMLIRY